MPPAIGQPAPNRKSLYAGSRTRNIASAANTITTAANAIVQMGSVGKKIRTLLGDRAAVREAHPITLPNDSEPEPDIAIVRAPNRQYLTHHPYPDDIFWLIEYANTTLKKDLNDKKRVYAEAGIEEYWVVNLQTSELIVFRDRAIDTYESETVLATGNISPLSFPDLQIDVIKLFTV